MKSVAAQAREFTKPLSKLTPTPSPATNPTVQPRSAPKNASGETYEESTEDDSELEPKTLDVDEGEEQTEIEKILDELADRINEPTLPRLSEEDVTLEMDRDCHGLGKPAGLAGTGTCWTFCTRMKPVPVQMGHRVQSFSVCFFFLPIVLAL
jgi:hypothetical protein